MTGIQELRQHLKGMPRTSSKVDIAFLKSLGDTLRKADGEEINLVYMQYVKEILNELYNKYFEDDSEIDEGVERAWLKARGTAIALSKGEVTGTDFYGEALILGRTIKKLAQTISAMALPLILLSEMLLVK